MKNHVTTFMAGLTILCVTPLSAMLDNTLVQDSAKTNQNKNKGSYSSCCQSLVQSFLKTGVIGGAIVWGAVHLGKKVDDISEPIQQVHMDSFNGALQFLSQINVTNFNNFLTIDPHAVNEAAHYIIVAGKIVELVRECPAAIPHLRGIYQDCFANQKQDNLLTRLTIEF